MRNVLTTLSRASLALVLMLLTPLTFSSSSSSTVSAGLAENAACAAKGEAGPRCVPELDAVCSYGGTDLYDHYLDD